MRAEPADAASDLAAAFDEAIDRLTDLARCLAGVRAVHRPRPRRLGGWAPRRCCCGQRFPCPTLLAAGLRELGSPAVSAVPAPGRREVGSGDA